MAGEQLNPDLDPRPEFVTYYPGDGVQYETALRSAFDFFRRHADRRYSSGSLMSLQNSADQAERFRLADPYGENGPASHLPTVIVAESPFTYDEETEVKTGGVVGMAVVDHDHDQKLMVAVHGQRRRQGIASALVHNLNTFGGWRMTSWVAPSNEDGQHFLLRMGFQPQALNRVGAVCYGISEIPTEDGAMFDEGELRQPRRRRRPRVQPAPLREDPFGETAVPTSRRPRDLSLEEADVVRSMAATSGDRRYATEQLQQLNQPIRGAGLRNFVTTVLSQRQTSQRREATFEPGGWVVDGPDVDLRPLTSVEEEECRSHAESPEHRERMERELASMPQVMDGGELCQWCNQHQQDEQARQRQLREAMSQLAESNLRRNLEAPLWGTSTS